LINIEKKTKETTEYPVISGVPRMASKITVNMIKEIHRAAIISGSRDEMSLIDLVRDEGTLFYIADKANKIDDEIERASFMLFSIAYLHPFVEGNKRTAVLAAEIALGPDLFIDADAEELNAAVRRIGSHLGTIEHTKEWMKTHVRKK